tara:strand:- start:248 stop:1642 length:1395 start_codon:yes stop_codon:yes gene_type:complete
MSYLNESDPNLAYGKLPGDSVPVPLVTWPDSILKGFNQNRLVPGEIRSTPYSWPGNSYTPAGLGGNSQQAYNLFEGSNNSIYNPISTSFNTTIFEGAEPNTSFASVVAGGDIVTVSSDPENNSGSNSVLSKYTIDIDTSNEGPLETAISAMGFVQSSGGGSASNSWSVFDVDSGGNLTAGAANQTLNVSGDGTYTQTENSSGLKLNYIRDCFERFAGDNATLSPTGQNEVLTIEGGTGITTSAAGTTITINNDFADQNVFTVIKGDNTGQDVTPDSTTDTLKFTNVTTNAIVKAALTIETDSASDEVRFNVVPQPHAGFGSQLVVIEGPGSSSGPHENNTVDTLPVEEQIDIPSVGILKYWKYTVKALIFDGLSLAVDGDGKSTNVTYESGHLYDFGRNKINKGGTAEALVSPTSTANLEGPTINGGVPNGAFWEIGTVLLAQKVSASGVWAIGMPPRLKAVCE